MYALYSVFTVESVTPPPRALLELLSLQLWTIRMSRMTFLWLLGLELQEL